MTGCGSRYGAIAAWSERRAASCGGTGGESESRRAGDWASRSARRRAKVARTGGHRLEEIDAGPSDTPLGR